jgi:hypothetical protein
MAPDPVQMVTQVARAIEKAGASYLVGGSLASSRYGLPRATQDIDLVADLQEEQIPLVVELLRDEFYVDAEMIRDAIQRRSSFNVIHMEAAFKIDVFLPLRTPWAQLQMPRRRLISLDPDDPSQTLYFCSPEDIILHKLDWYRVGGGVSDRQWSDILGVLKVQAGALEAPYLRHWAGELGLTELLDRALGAAGVTL